MMLNRYSDFSKIWSSYFLFKLNLRFETGIKILHPKVTHNKNIRRKTNTWNKLLHPLFLLMVKWYKSNKIYKKIGDLILKIRYEDYVDCNELPETKKKVNIH